MQTGLRGPDGDVEDRGGLSQWKVEIEMEDHHRPLIHGQPPQLAAEPVALGERTGEVGAARLGLGLDM